MNYGRIGFHTLTFALAVAVGILFAGSEGAVVGLIYLTLLGVIGNSISEVFEEIYFYFQGKVLANV